MGRKLKLSPETMTKLGQAWRVGATDKAAAGFAGMSLTTYYAMFEAARCDAAGEPITEPQFRSAKVRAMLRELVALKEREHGNAQVRLLANIEKAAPKDWRAAAELLRLRWPTDFGRQLQDVRLSGNPDGPPVGVRHVVVLPDEIDDVDQWEQRATNYAATKASAMSAAADGDGEP